MRKYIKANFSRFVFILFLPLIVFFFIFTTDAFAHEGKINSNINAELNSTETVASLSVSDSIIQGGQVQFAVWNLNKGQNPIYWYTVNDAYNEAKYNCNIIDFKLPGKYAVHVYYNDNQVQQQFLGSSSFEVSPLSSGSLEVFDKDKIALSFKINETNVQSFSGVSKFQFAIWTENGGQDDLKWYDGKAILDPNGTYYSSITEYVFNHKYENGIYNIHVYAIGNNGVQTCVNTLSVSIDLVEINVSANINSTQTKSDLHASSPIIQGGQVKFAVWNLQKGQNPIKWYTVTNPYTSAEYECNITDFKLSGTYAVHVYYCNVHGLQIFMGSTNFKVSPINSGNLEVTNKDKATLSFIINETKVKSDSGIAKFEYAVWTDNAGQDDIKWAEAKGNLDSDGSFYFQSTIFVSNHKYENGKYHIHVYAIGNNGVENCVNTISEDISLVDTKLSAELNTAQTSSTLCATSPLIQGGQVQFAVWNLNKGQNPIKWYIVNNPYNEAKCNCNIVDFKFSGKYAVHVYYFDVQGKQIFLGSTNFEVSQIESGKLEITNKDKSSLSFKINESKVKSASGVSKFELAVWTEKGGQDDIKWADVTSSLDLDGTYYFQATEYVLNHNYENGKYYIHVYAIAKNGVSTCVNTISENIELVENSFTHNVNEEQTTVTLQIINDAIYSAKKLEFAVWSDATKQKDVKWYEVKIDIITGKLIVNLSDFKQVGTYHAHSYITTNSGDKKFLTGLAFDIIKPTLQSSITNIDGHIGTFDIEINKLTSYQSVKDVEVPTFTDKETGAHATWYMAKKIDDQNYTATSDVKDHEFEFGNYSAHIYIKMKNGCEFFVTSHKLNIQANDYLGVKRMGNSIYRAVAKGLHSVANKVEFPTWSNEKAQDDIVWYQGVHTTADTWSVDFSARCHFDAGYFHTHCYLYDSAGQKDFVNSVMYQVPEEDVRKPFTLYRGITQGVDVSEHQGFINWYGVGNSNQVGFAMIRAGFGTTRADYEFENNYINAVRTGIPVGAYWFSYARSVPEAQAEARKCLEVLGGRYFDLPIAFDLEWYDDIDLGTNTAMINAFCEIINAAGYQPMVYASEFWFNNKISINGLYPWIYLWGARWSQYEPQIAHKERMRIWQFSASGSVGGISGAVDMDKIYY